MAWGRVHVGVLGFKTLSQQLDSCTEFHTKKSDGSTEVKKGVDTGFKSEGTEHISLFVEVGFDLALSKFAGSRKKVPVRGDRGAAAGPSSS